ncbi:MAG: peptide chain release factor N(5)-glutamine methyltransferase [Chloroflexi bacterium]|nr:peptide chain release factor N(5)-glutamine methyltransferase [Chloroflexota bacterium]
MMLTDVGQALAWGRAALAGASGTEPLDAQVLLGAVLGLDRASLLAHPKHPLHPDQCAGFQAHIQQRKAGTPVAYLTGTHPFYDRDFAVTPSVLIPRPETEHLVEAVLHWAGEKQAAGKHHLSVADIGTGSGIIAVILAAHLPHAGVWAVDVSMDALGVARHNVARYDLADRVRLLHGHLLQPLLASGQMVDVIAANLPYIAPEELATLVVAQHEPRLALDGGADGLALIRELLRDVPRVLRPGGLVALEIGAGQAAAVTDLAAHALLGAQISIKADYAGHERVVCIASRSKLNGAHHLD